MSDNASETQPVKKKRGRPLGSKGKKKSDPSYFAHRPAPTDDANARFLDLKNISDEVREVIRFLPTVGYGMEEISKIFNININTLKAHFQDELTDGTAIMLSKIAGRVFKEALYTPGRDGLAAAYFVLKTKAGWRETSRQELTGADGKDLGPAILIPVDAPKQETLEEFLARRKVELLGGND